MARTYKRHRDDASEGLFRLVLAICGFVAFSGGGFFAAIGQTLINVAWQAFVWTLFLAIIVGLCWSGMSFLRSIPEMIKFLRELREMRRDYREAMSDSDVRRRIWDPD